MALNRYYEKAFENDLPPLAEEDRIYLCVTYQTRGLARCCHCNFDNEKKLWFTGAFNARIRSLVRVYGIHEHTSEKARELLRMSMEAKTKTD